jgi:hypothetical protein
MSEQERQIERCARRAAELLVSGDRVLTDNPASPLLGRLLAALDADLRADVYIGGRVALAATAPTLCLLHVESAALDGSVLCRAEAFECAAAAQELGIPCYILLPGGPDCGLATVDAGILGAEQRVLTPEQVSAAVTDRGIYRPAMLARYCSDGDMPLDIITLS